MYGQCLKNDELNNCLFVHKMTIMCTDKAMHAFMECHKNHPHLKNSINKAIIIHTFVFKQEKQTIPIPEKSRQKTSEISKIKYLMEYKKIEKKPGYIPRARCPVYALITRRTRVAVSLSEPSDAENGI